jgi:hypothetical protein
MAARCGTTMVPAVKLSEKLLTAGDEPCDDHHHRVTLHQVEAEVAAVRAQRAMPLLWGDCVLPGSYPAV